MIIDKNAKNTQGGKDRLFNKWCWENRIATNWAFHLHTKIDFKWIKDLSVIPATIKLVRRKHRGGNFSMLFLEMISWLRHRKHRQPKQKQTGGTTSN